MKTICIFALLGLALAAVPATSSAQEWFGAATWDISIPTGDTKKFVDDSSFRGFGLDFRNRFRPNTTVGITTAWEVFHQRTTSTIEVDGKNGGVTITGSQDRYINSFPIMLGVHRYFGAEGGPRPYLGVSGGGYILIQTLRIGLAEFEDDRWAWGVMPEAGVVIQLQSGAALVVNGRYNWASTQDLAGRDKDLTYWGIRAGFVWEQY